MSAYMVEDSLINDVVNTLAVLRDCEWVLRKIKEHGYDLALSAGRELLANEMFELNINGVEARYGDCEAKLFRPLDFKYKGSLPVPIIQCYKSLGCFLYQCAEGDIYKDNGLYHLLTEVEHALAANIVNNLPEYQKAKW
jgi:hypothetical protein